MEGGPVSLSDQKLKEELENLRLERQKLLQDISEARRPYLFRNAQILTALIATLGALVGLYITIKTDYFTKLRLQGELAEKVANLLQREAESARKEAEAQKNDANRIMEGARIQKHDADELKVQSDGERLIAEKVKADSARQIVLARAQVERAREEATRANLEVFKASPAPSYLYVQQAQLSAMELSLPFAGYGWITTSSLKQLSCLIRDAETLRSIPISVHDLSLWTGAHGLDLHDFGNLQGLRKLAVRAYSEQKDSFEIKGLSNAINLEEFAIETSAPSILGLEPVAALQKIRSFSVTANSVEGLSSTVVERATRIQLHFQGSSSVYSRLINSRNLKTLAVSGGLAPDDMRFLRSMPNLTALALGRLGSFHFGPEDKFPNITSIAASINTLDDAVGLAKAFPNLADLSIEILNTWDVSRFQEMLELIEKSYPRLQTLSLQAINVLGREAIVIPAVAELKALRVSIRPVSPNVTTIKVRLRDVAGLGKLRSLIVDGPILYPGDLSQLSTLESLILNDVEKISILQEVSPLLNLKALGLSAQGQLRPEFRALLQEIVDSRPLERLVLDRQIMGAIDRLPNSVRSLGLEEPYQMGTSFGSTTDYWFPQ